MLQRMRNQGAAQLATLPRLFGAYGMLGVLVLLAALFSLLTLRPQRPEGTVAAGELAGRLQQEGVPGGSILVAGGSGPQDKAFTSTLAGRLKGLPGVAVRAVTGEPAALRQALRLLGESPPPRLVATVESAAPSVRAIVADLGLADTRILVPPARRWPTFLLPENLRNVAHQVAVIAILAAGMTVVIITGGIDLSVGSLIALAAVVVAWTVGRLGGEEAGLGGVLAGGLAAILCCGAAGALSGLVITRFRVPPFIATLGMMQVASGLAYLISAGRPIYHLPAGFVRLGRGVDPLLGIPWAVLLMLGLFAAAHLLMSRTALGRYVYAVGGNSEAARLAGVRVGAVLMFAYVTSGMLAGLGGVVMASQLRSGAPTYGLMYELYVIAAVVVGGTSLSGGQGRVLGTLVGVFIIAVIQNGMNLTNVESYTQKVVLGLVILGAVLLDRLRRR
jgi:ribose transport system permease protein